MQLNDLNPLINYVLRIQFRYKMWRALITLLHTVLSNMRPAGTFYLARGSPLEKNSSTDPSTTFCWQSVRLRRNNYCHKNATIGRWRGCCTAGDIDLQQNTALQHRQNDCTPTEFWMRYVPEGQFPEIVKCCKKVLTMFGSTCVRSCIFSREQH